MKLLNLGQCQKSKHFHSHCERKGDVTEKKLYIPNCLITNLLKFSKIKQRNIKGSTLFDQLCPPEVLLLIISSIKRVIQWVLWPMAQCFTGFTPAWAVHFNWLTYGSSGQPGM